LTFLRCAQARALIAGREYVVPDDLKSLARACLGHRLVLLRSAATGVGAADDVIAQAVTATPVPLRG
jgi:MoxR-like ATPase